ncbi:TPA: hypothetical protein J1074_004700 [Escherichia coli]|nr:hypothetical protein [Escherichia coli]
MNALPLKNRIIMPPMTRSRAGDVTTDMMADYYAQRASAGLSSAKVRKSAEALRIIFHGTLIYSGKYTKARAEADCQI